LFLGANSTPLKRLMENNGKSPKKSAKTTANKSTSTLLNSATLGSAFDEVYKKIIEDFYRTTNFAIELGIAAEIETGSPSGTQIGIIKNFFVLHQNKTITFSENTESSSFLGNLTGSRKTNINKKLDPTNSQPVNNSETTKTSQPLNIIPASSSNNKMSSSDEWEEVVGKKHSTSEKANKNTPQKEVTKKKIMVG
jgi:hypothetical protein